MISLITSMASASATAMISTTQTWWGSATLSAGGSTVAQAPGQITEMVITNSRSGGGRELTRQQAEAAVGFAISDLCPDAAPAVGRPG
jgi:hypothetical protein